MTDGYIQDEYGNNLYYTDNIENWNAAYGSGGGTITNNDGSTTYVTPYTQGQNQIALADQQRQSNSDPIQSQNNPYNQTYKESGVKDNSQYIADQKALIQQIYDSKKASGTASLTDTLNAQKQAYNTQLGQANTQYTNQKTELQNAYDKAVSVLNKNRTNVNQNALTAGNAADANSMTSNNRLAEILAANGQRGGVNRQQHGLNEATRQNNLSNINRDKNTQLAGIDTSIGGLTADNTTAVNSLSNTYNNNVSDLNTKIANLDVSQQQQLAALLAQLEAEKATNEVNLANSADSRDFKLQELINQQNQQNQNNAINTAQVTGNYKDPKTGQTTPTIAGKTADSNIAINKQQADTATKSSLEKSYKDKIAQFSNDYQAEINKVQNDGDSSNDWQIAYLNEARNAKKANNLEKEKETISQYSEDYQAEINRRNSTADTSDDELIPYLQAARQQKVNAINAANKSQQTVETKQAYSDALKRWETAGYVVSPSDASILGVPQGTKTNDASYRESQLAVQKAAAENKTPSTAGKVTESDIFNELQKYKSATQPVRDEDGKVTGYERVYTDQQIADQIIQMYPNDEVKQLDWINKLGLSL